MQVSISKAHKLTGVARSTIYKDIKQGKLSVSIDARGKKTIVVSELHRVYGELEVDKPDVDRQVLSDEASGAGRSHRDKPLQEGQVAVLQERIEALRTKIGDQDGVIEDLKGERLRSRELYEEHIDGLKDALAKAQDGYNNITKLLEDKSSLSGAGEWERSIKSIEARLVNQEKAVKEKAEREDKVLRQNRMLKKALGEEKNKSMFKKIFG